MAPPTMRTVARPTVKRKLLTSRPSAEIGGRRRLTTPVILTELGQGKLVTFPASDLKGDRLQIDYSYQRQEITLKVNELIHVLQAGGVVPDPIIVAERPNGQLFIVDGQQRYWAHWHAEKPLHGIIYKIASIPTEARLYHVLNNRTSLTADAKVKAWQGPAAALLRQMGQSHPAFKEQINFGQGGGRNRRYSAAGLIKAMLIVSNSGLRYQGRIDVMLPRLDMALKQSGAPDRVRTLLGLYGSVFVESKKVPALALYAVAKVAGKRWVDTVMIPSETIQGRIARMDWPTLAPGMADRFLPVLEEEVAKRWK